MKKIIFILVFTILINFVSANDLNSPNRICNGIYYFILETEYNYSEQDLNNLGIKLNTTNITYYLNNYYEECYLKGYSEKLPNKPLPKIIIYKNNSLENECDLEKNPVFKTSLPFFEVYLGNLSCSSAKSLDYLFKLEKNTNYSIKGIRIFPIVFILLICVVISFIRGNGMMNRAIKKIFKEDNL